MITKLVTLFVFVFIVHDFVNKLHAEPYAYNSLPMLDTLLSILHKTDSVQLVADLEEYKHTYRFSYLYLVPSVGYDMVNSKPMIIFNSSNLITYFQNKRVIERKEISLKSKSLIHSQNNKIKIITSYNDLKNSILQLEMIFETYKKYKLLFELKEKQNKANEINSEAFLKEQIAFSEKRKIVVTSIDFINDKFTAIELILNEKLFESLTYDMYLNGN